MNQPISMVKLAHQVAGIAPKEEPKPMAAVRLEFWRGGSGPTDCTLVIRHGDNNEVLMRRDVARRFWMRELWPLLEGELNEALAAAKAALVGDSNDAEHDALVSFVKAMGLEIPDCTCDEGPTARGRHDEGCPSKAWEGDGR